MNGFLVFFTVAVAAIGPFVAVYRGARAFDAPDDDAPDDTDNTNHIPQVTDDPYLY